jgi:cell division protein ZipA
MDSLRWILLGLGVLVIIGVYVWTRWQAAREDRQYESMLAGDLEADPLTYSGDTRDAGFEPIDDELGALDRAVYEDDTFDPAIEDFDTATSAEIEPEPVQAPANDSAPAAADEKLLVFYLVANRTVPFKGKALRKSFGKAGLEFGEMDIYHRRTSSGAPVFSVANLVEPGTFDQRTMDSSETRGVSLFMRLPGPVPTLSAFDDFSNTA